MTLRNLDRARRVRIIRDLKRHLFGQPLLRVFVGEPRLHVPRPAQVVLHRQHNQVAHGLLFRDPEPAPDLRRHPHRLVTLARHPANGVLIFLEQRQLGLAHVQIVAEQNPVARDGPFLDLEEPVRLRVLGLQQFGIVEGIFFRDDLPVRQQRQCFTFPLIDGFDDRHQPACEGQRRTVFLQPRIERHIGEPVRFVR